MVAMEITCFVVTFSQSFDSLKWWASANFNRKFLWLFKSSQNLKAAFFVKSEDEILYSFILRFNMQVNNLEIMFESLLLYRIHSNAICLCLLLLVANLYSFTLYTWEIFTVPQSFGDFIPFFFSNSIKNFFCKVLSLQSTFLETRGVPIV